MAEKEKSPIVEEKEEKPVNVLASLKSKKAVMERKINENGYVTSDQAYELKKIREQIEKLESEKG